MDDDEFEDDETYEDREESPFDSTVDTPDDSDSVDSSEHVSDYAGIHRAMFLLIIVLLLGIVLLGLFMAMRPAPVIVPTMKPPWLV